MDQADNMRSYPRIRERFHHAGAIGEHARRPVCCMAGSEEHDIRHQAPGIGLGQWRNGAVAQGSTRNMSLICHISYS